MRPIFALNTRDAVQVSVLGVAVISASGILVPILVLASAFLDRLLEGQRSVTGAAREAEEHFRMLAEAIPQIVWTTGPDGSADYCNKRWYEVMRLTEAQSLSKGWSEMIHPDDRAVYFEKWERALHTGEAFELEYRLRDAAKGFRWYLGRATPMREPTGAIVKWFGTCTDIEDQEHNQQVLEEQIPGAHRGAG